MSHLYLPFIKACIPLCSGISHSFIKALLKNDSSVFEIKTIPVFIQQNQQIERRPTTKVRFGSSLPPSAGFTCPPLERHVSRLTAEKTQQRAPGYRWKMDEFLYLPSEESAVKACQQRQTKASSCIGEQLQCRL